MIIGFTINSIKLKYMISERNRDRSGGVGDEIVIEMVILEVVKDVVEVFYCGIVVTRLNTCIQKN